MLAEEVKRLTQLEKESARLKKLLAEAELETDGAVWRELLACKSKALFHSFVLKYISKMYIKSMVIDGFKSYGQRTEINGFDPMFNAITGLNGSGKSNILDAICFLLGITNLTHVRATNLQELVYKSGQAGVTKATVTVTFDNTDKKQSPIGYEHYDEVTVTRQVLSA